MTTNFKWTVTDLECLPVAPGTNLPNCVWMVHWTCTATSDQINTVTNKPYTSSSYGTIRINYEKDETYIPYDQLTESQVISWVHEVMNRSSEITVSTVEEGLSKIIADQITPPVVKPALPW